MLLTSIAARRIQRIYRLYKAAKLQKELAADQALHDAQREQNELLSAVASSHAAPALDDHAHLELDIHQEEDDSYDESEDDWDNPVQFCGYRCGLQCWECQRRADYYEQMSHERFDMADEF